MFKIFVEGYEMPCARVQVETGIGPLQAQVVIPPGEYRRKILPGSRVLAYVKDNGKYYEWFQGITTNSPEIAIGFDEHPVTLAVIGEIGLLQSILMNYLTIGQTDRMRNQTFLSSSFSGRVNLFRAGADIMMFPFAGELTDRNIGFGDRLVGVLQGMISMDPQGWEDLRRLQYLDRLSVEMADGIADTLDTALVFNSIAKVIGSLQQESFTALDILNLILQMSLHELVSIAPVRFSGDMKMRRVSRHSNYLPSSVTLNGLADMSQQQLVKAMCTRSLAPMEIDHFIKPVDRFFVPDSNKITKGMYSTAYISDQAATRSIIKVPIMGTNGPIVTFERVQPETLSTITKIIQSASVKTEKSPAIGSTSSVMCERTSGFRTNEEKIRGGIRASFTSIDPRVNNMLNVLQNKEREDRKKEGEYQESYIDAMIRYEYEKSSGAFVNIRNATFNLAPIPGYGIRVEDSNGNWYSGKLVKKTDVIDLESSVASSSYTITECKAEKALDYNGAIGDTRNPIDTWFAPYGENRQSELSPVFQSYAAGLKDKELAIALSGYVDYERSLAVNHLMETSERELNPETRFERNSSGIFLTNTGGNLPGISVRNEITTTEAFYSDFDLLTESAAQVIEPTVNELLDFLPYLNINKEEAVSILDTKQGNIFSVFLKTINDEVIAKAAAEATIGQLLRLDKSDWNIIELAAGEVIEESQAAAITAERAARVSEIVESENARIDGTNSELKKMFGRYNPNFPLYLGNPCPLRMEILLWFMSRINESEYKSFLEFGTATFNLGNTGFPRPMSDREVIRMRREIAKKASNE